MPSPELTERQIEEITAYLASLRGAKWQMERLGRADVRPCAANAASCHIDDARLTCRHPNCEEVLVDRKRKIAGGRAISDIGVEVANALYWDLAVPRYSVDQLVFRDLADQFLQSRWHDHFPRRPTHLSKA
jgi:hypothetical protein